MRIHTVKRAILIKFFSNNYSCNFLVDKNVYLICVFKYTHINEYKFTTRKRMNNKKNPLLIVSNKSTTGLFVVI